MKNNYQTKRISDCIESVPKKSSIHLKKYQSEGRFPIIDQGQRFIGGYTDDASVVYGEILPVIIFGDHTRSIKFIDFPFAIGADGTKILKPKGFLDARYFYFVLLSLNVETRGYARHFRILKDKEILLPPIEEQKKIVARLEKLLAKVKEAKRLRVEADAATQALLSAELHKIFEKGRRSGWEERVFGEIAKLDTKKNIKDNLPYIGMEDIKSNSGEFLGSLGSRRVKSVTNYFNDKHLLYGKLRPYLNKVFLPNFEGHCTTEFIPMLPNENIITREWLLYWITSKEIVEKISKTCTGARMPRADMKEVLKFKIKIPPIKEQKKIVARLDVLSEKLSKIKQYQQSVKKDIDHLEQSILRQAFSER